MTQRDFQKLLVYLSKKYTIYAPQKIGGRLLVREIKDFEKFKLTAKRPFYSHKKFLIPPSQVLFCYKRNKFIKPAFGQKQVLLGIPIYDLKAFTLLHQVFEKDAYFQEIIRNTVLVGHSPVPEHTTFYEMYEEHVLEHLKFDIFLEFKPKGEFRVFAGSEEAQKILEAAGIKDYEYIEYAGPMSEEGLSKAEIDKLNLVKNLKDAKIWIELGQKCLACGKCSIACPTCFCFDTSDEIGFDKKQGKRLKKWSICFFKEFSEIAGGEKFLKTIKDRIYNWYEHKFVRIPSEYNLPGCVGCGRCIEVCPAKIDLRQTFKHLRRLIK